MFFGALGSFEKLRYFGVRHGDPCAMGQTGEAAL